MRYFRRNYGMSEDVPAVFCIRSDQVGIKGDITKSEIFHEITEEEYQICIMAGGVVWDVDEAHWILK